MNHERRSMNGVRRPGGDCSPRPARGGTRQPGEQDPGALLGVSWASASSWSHRGDWGVRLLWPKQSDRESIAASGMPPSDVSTDRPVWPMTGSTLAPGPRTAATGFDPPRYSRSSMATWADHCEAALTAGQDDARGRRGVRGRSSFAAGRTWPASVAEDNRSSGRSWNWVVACRLINLNPW
jgi:hypothetical protein